MFVWTNIKINFYKSRKDLENLLWKKENQVQYLWVDGLSVDARTNNIDTWNKIPWPWLEAATLFDKCET